MKILKIFGVVVGLHVFLLILIFANPGCSSTNKPAPTAADTVVPKDSAPPVISVPSGAGSSGSSPVTSAGTENNFGGAPASFDPNAVAGGVRFSPTRPGTSAAAALDAQPVSDVTPASTYAVAKGDSLWTIAKKHHITVAELAGANNLKAGATVRVSQKLIIPGAVGSGTTHVPESAASKSAASASAPAVAAPAARTSTDSVHHIVKPGETLGAIARKYQVKVGEVATANNISDPAKIRPGMELIIPGWQSPTTKSTKSAVRPHAERAQPASSTPPTIVTPADQPSEPAATSGANEPPVIQVEQAR